MILQSMLSMRDKQEKTLVHIFMHIQLIVQTMKAMLMDGSALKQIKLSSLLMIKKLV
jgi:hypothetical protein